MQISFINNLRKLINEGADKALLLSSTGERDIFMTGGRNAYGMGVSAAWS